jgi:ferredoxin
MSDYYARNPSNCDGPFYVVRDECIACGAPESEAGDLMSHDDSGQCFFVRQPSNPHEVDAAIRAVWSSCCAAVRYGGGDPAILTRFANLGELSRCDVHPSPEPPIVVRDCARFEFRNPDSDASIRAELKSIMNFFSESMSNKYSQNSGFRRWSSSGSFSHQWGGPPFKHTFSIRFHFQNEGKGRWLLRMSENDYARTGMAIRIDSAVRRSDLFQGIRWFSEDEIMSGVGNGQLHPY